jgi:hypothetical protein
VFYTALSTDYYISVDNAMNFFVRFRNDSSYRLRNSTIQIRFLDGNRNVIKDWQVSGIGVSDSLAPGEIGFGRGTVAATARPANWATYSVVVSGSPTTLPPVTFAFSNLRFYYDAAGLGHLAGVVRNTSTVDTAFGIVYGAILDTSGNVYEVEGIAFVLALGRELRPGESYSFDLRFNRPLVAAMPYYYGGGSQ